MKDQKVFVGTASHQWNDPFTYAIGTTQSEVDEYLRESSIEESKHNLDDCDSLETEDCQHNGCGFSVDVADDISFGSIETDNVEQILACMDDDEVIKLGDLDRIAIGDAIQLYPDGWKVEGSFRNDEWIDGYIEIFETPKTEREARYAMLWKLIDAYYTEIDHAPDAVDYLQQKFDFVS